MTTIGRRLLVFRVCEVASGDFIQRSRVRYSQVLHPYDRL